MPLCGPLDLLNPLRQRLVVRPGGIPEAHIIVIISKVRRLKEEERMLTEQ
jgi:hypothetical protein